MEENDSSTALLSKFRRSEEERRGGAKVGGKDEINSRLYCALKVAGNLFNDLADRHRGGLPGEELQREHRNVARSRKCARGLENDRRM